MNTRASILLVDDEPNILRTMRICLEAAGFEITTFANPVQALDSMRDTVYDIAFFDLKMEPMDGLELLRQSRVVSPSTTVVLMTAHGSVDSAVAAIKQGAHDYLQKPFELRELQHFTEKVLEHHQLTTQVRSLREQLSQMAGTGEIITRSDRVKAIMALALQVAPSTIPVLIEGESGTGKELLAQLIHRSGPRKDGPFVTVNCAALPETLLESELFGHIKGAFTGAVRDRVGRCEAAGGGTIFLDEIGEIPASTQVKLLRFLQSKQFERVGESATRQVDARVIAATNRELEAAVNAGAFREDFFYRLNGMRLKLPPLRERTEDIPLLTHHFLKKHGADNDIARDAMEALEAYPWKGNVRELENVVERARILARDGIIMMHHLPEEFQTFTARTGGALSLEEMEHQQIIKVLRIAKDLDEAASILGIDPATLWRKRKKYNL